MEVAGRNLLLLDEIAMAAQMAEGCSDFLQQVADGGTGVRFRAARPGEPGIHPAIAVDDLEQLADPFLARATVGGMQVIVQDVQSLCSVQPLRSFKLQTPPSHSNDLSGLNDWNMFRTA